MKLTVDALSNWYIFFNMTVFLVFGRQTALTLTKDFKQGVRAGAVAAATTFIWGQVHNGLDGTQANAVSNGGTGNAAWLDSAGYSSTQVSMIKVGTHMAVGGTISAIQGNGFARGAAAAGVSKGYYEAGLSFADDNVIFHALEAGVIGGTTSRIMGGNFAQGALLAAFARLFNDRGLWNAQPGDSGVRSPCENTDLLNGCKSDYIALMGSSAPAAKKIMNGLKLHPATKALLDAGVDIAIEEAAYAACCLQNAHMFDSDTPDRLRKVWRPLDDKTRREIEIQNATSNVIDTTLNRK